MDTYPPWFRTEELKSARAIMAGIRKKIFDGIVDAVEEQADNFVFFIDKRYLLSLMDELSSRFPGRCYVDMTDDSGLYKHYEVYRDDSSKYHYIGGSVPCMIELDSPPLSPASIVRVLEMIRKKWCASTLLKPLCRCAVCYTGSHIRPIPIW